MTVLNQKESLSNNDKVKKLVEGKRVAFSGKVKGYTRGMLSNLVDDLGGRMVTSVTSKTDILFSDASQTKRKTKAEELNIPIYPISDIILKSSIVSEATFPMSNVNGHSTKHLKTSMMWDMAKTKKTVTSKELKSILKKHLDFLNSGGFGGSWSTYEAGGIVLGIYYGSSTKGKYADFYLNNIDSQTSMANLNLAYGNFCGVYAPNVDFSGTNLKGALFTDAFLDGADFSNCDLSGADFSRASMRDCKFNGANLIGSDFENCDCSNSDFSASNRDRSRFPGTKLVNIIF